MVLSFSSFASFTIASTSSAVRSQQIADDVCGKHSAFGVIAGQEFHRAEPVLFVLPRRSMSCCLFILSVSLSLHSPEFVAETLGTSSCHSAGMRRSSRLHCTTDYATVVLPLPGISNDLEVVRLL